MAIAVVLVALALAAYMSNGALLLTWDEPIQRAVEDARTAGATAVFRRISFLGSTVDGAHARHGAGGRRLAALPGGRRRRRGGDAGRPLLEFTFKDVVARDRPDLERLVNGVGSFVPERPRDGVGRPVGAGAARRHAVHPRPADLVGVRGRLGGLIVAIGASRIYLGVHWFPTSSAGFIVGAFFLIGVEWVLRQRHRRDPCTALRLLLRLNGTRRGRLGSAHGRRCVGGA